MSLDTKTRTLGEHTYSVRELGSLEARTLLVSLTKTLGPVLGALLEESQGAASPVPMDASGLAALSKTALSRKGLSRALVEFSQRLTVAEQENLIRIMASVSSLEYPDGRVLQLNKERIELHFKGGNLLAMYKWLGFCLEVQYADFFPVVVSGQNDEKDAPSVEGSASKSPQD